MLRYVGIGCATYSLHTAVGSYRLRLIEQELQIFYVERDECRTGHLLNNITECKKIESDYQDCLERKKRIQQRMNMHNRDIILWPISLFHEVTLLIGEANEKIYELSKKIHNNKIE